MRDLADDDEPDDDEVIEAFWQEMRELAWELFHFSLALECGSIARPSRGPVAGWLDTPTLTAADGDAIRYTLRLAALQKEYAIIHAGLICQGVE